MPAFTLDDLIDCYRQGIFPMSDSRDDPTLYLVDPEWRGVLPLERFHVPARLARSVRQDLYQVRINTRFSEIVSLCAETAKDRDDTWISEGIQALYEALFARGMAHSVECWQGDQLVGGLYGVSLGGAFFGESMVSRARDASKVALVHLVARLKVGGYRLLDTQFQTDHLRQFGTEEIAREAYKARLKAALEIEGDFYRLAPATDGLGALQSITQTS